MNAPKLEELLTLSRKKDRNKQTKRLVFAHGAVLFSARKRKNRIEIEVDCWGTRNLLPAVQSQLADRHSEYLSDHPDVKLGGAATSFGPSGCRCHVAPEHADHWLELLFGVNGWNNPDFEFRFDVLVQVNFDHVKPQFFQNTV